jgi:hypothetical protein
VAPEVHLPSDDEVRGVDQSGVPFAGHDFRIDPEMSVSTEIPPLHGVDVPVRGAIAGGVEALPRGFQKLLVPLTTVRSRVCPGVGDGAVCG